MGLARRIPKNTSTNSREKGMLKNTLAVLLTMVFIGVSAMSTWNTVRMIALVLRLQAEHYLTQTYLGP
jgi:hypothetical protein